MRSAMARTYTVVLEREDDGGYSVHVPALKGCHTQGDTLAEALLMAEEAIVLCLESLAERGFPVPEDTPDISVSTREVAEVLVCRLPVREAMKTA